MTVQEFLWCLVLPALVVATWALIVGLIVLVIAS